MGDPKKYEDLNAGAINELQVYMNTQFIQAVVSVIFTKEKADFFLREIQLKMIKFAPAFRDEISFVIASNRKAIFEGIESAEKGAKADNFLVNFQGGTA